MKRFLCAILALTLLLCAGCVQEAPVENGGDETASTTSTDATTSTTAPDTTTTAHVHVFEDATCEKPATCACGETKGKKAAHTYQNGVCTVCGAKAPVATLANPNPKDKLKFNVEYIGHFRLKNGELRASAFFFDGQFCAVTERFFTSEKPDDDATPIVYQGKTYYSVGGGHNPFAYTLTDTEILITHSVYSADYGEPTMRLVMQSNGMLRITKSGNSDFPNGAVFSTNMKDVLK